MRQIDGFITLPKVSIHKHNTSSFNTGNVEYYVENTIREVVGQTGIEFNYGPSRYEPILPKLKVKLNSESPGQSCRSIFLLHLVLNELLIHDCGAKLEIAICDIKLGMIWKEKTSNMIKRSC